MKSIDIVILTDSRYIDIPHPTVYQKNVLLEDTLIKEALEKEGLIVKRQSWDNPTFNWESSKYLLFRTTWDCFEKFDTFSKWFDKTATVSSFINPKNSIYWNLDKHYFIDLEANGIHCTPTLFIEKGTHTTLAKLYEQTGWKNAVLKPCFSSGARHTYKVTTKNIDEHEALFKTLIKEEAMMLQPFQKNIVEKGEISMMIIGGVFTHAVLKKTKKGDFRVQDNFGGSVHKYTPSKKEISFAEKAVHACKELPSYARVDIFEDNQGAITLAELELIEPELWFRYYPKAAEYLASYIKKAYFK